MKTYLDPVNEELFAYEMDGSQDHIIPSNFILMTDEEVENFKKEKKQKNFFITIEQCKEMAKIKLLQTDWTQLSDISIANKNEFDEYRKTIRNFYIYPIENPIWPSCPNPIWN